jgi:hypothetical protein
MKVAVFVYGMYREFDIAIKSWKFLQEINNDVYFSTWNTSIQKNKRLDITIDEEVSCDRITKHIPTAIVNVESDTSTLSNPQKLVYHWKQCLRMMKESGKQYDIVMLTRPDSFKVIQDPKSIYKWNTPNVLYGLEKIIDSTTGPFIQDVFFVGSTQTISHLVDTIPLGIESIHNGLAGHILSLGYEVEEIEGVHIATVRANARSLSDNELTLSKVFAKTMEWGDNQEQYLDSTEN